MSPRCAYRAAFLLCQTAPDPARLCHLISEALGADTTLFADILRGVHRLAALGEEVQAGMFTAERVGLSL